MKVIRLVGALSFLLPFACSSPDDGDFGGTGGSGTADPQGSGGSGAGSALGSGGGDGSTTGGSTGAPAGSGGAGAADSGAGGADLGSGGADPGSGGESAATGGQTGSGGTPGGDGCSPNPSGSFVVDGDVVFDEKTCLSWMKANTSGDPYAEAVAYCEGLDLGGFTDWRIPTAGEVTTIFKCDGMCPPIDDTIFTIMGDGIWTSTESGTIAGDLPKVCGAGQSSGNFYDFGQVGGQNTRCVRGSASIPDRPNCHDLPVNEEV